MNIAANNLTPTHQGFLLLSKSWELLLLAAIKIGSSRLFAKNKV